MIVEIKSPKSRESKVIPEIEINFSCSYSLNRRGFHHFYELDAYRTHNGARRQFTGCAEEVDVGIEVQYVSLTRLKADQTFRSNDDCGSVSSIDYNAR